MMNSIPCGVVRDLLPLYCDQALSDESRALVEAHLAVCPECASALKGIEAAKKHMPCGVVRDLLPLYCDQALGDESRALVEAHLKICPGCTKALEGMKAEIPIPSEADLSIREAWRGFHRALRRTRIRAVLIGLVIVIFLSWAVPIAWDELTNVGRVPVSLENIEVEDLKRTSSGQLLFKIMLKDGTRWIGYSEWDGEDGILYYSDFERALIPLRDTYHDNWIEPDVSLRDGKYFMSTETEYDQKSLNSSEWTELKGIRIGTKDLYITVWEPGMNVPLVDQETDRWYQKMYEETEDDDNEF